MNSDLMNIIETQANDDDLLSPRPRSLEDKKGNNNNGGTPHYNFGLSLGRSQSAAPQWNFSNNPTSTKSAVADSSIGGTNNSERDIFGSGSRFFSEGAGTNEEGGGDQDDIIRRPASTGVIGRPTNEAEDGDVNSILETLGLASLGTSTATNNGQPSPYSTKSLGMVSHNTPKKSLMEKINEGNNNQTQEDGVGNNYGAGSSSYFTNDKDPGSKALFQGKHEINQAAPTQIQYVQAPPQAAQVQQRQEQHSHYNPQQQIYYQQAPYQTQDYRGQQVYVVPQQQNVYHVNQAPASLCCTSTAECLPRESGTSGTIWRIRSAVSSTTAAYYHAPTTDCSKWSSNAWSTSIHLSCCSSSAYYPRCTRTTTICLYSICPASLCHGPKRANPSIQSSNDELQWSSRVVTSRRYWSKPPTFINEDTRSSEGKEQHSDITG